MNGYIWEVTSSTGQKWRIPSEGLNVEEGISEFRRIHGYSHTIFKVKYLMKVGEEHD